MRVQSTPDGVRATELLRTDNCVVLERGIPPEVCEAVVASMEEASAAYARAIRRRFSAMVRRHMIHWATQEEKLKTAFFPLCHPHGILQGNGLIYSDAAKRLRQLLLGSGVVQQSMAELSNTPLGDVQHDYDITADALWRVPPDQTPFVTHLHYPRSRDVSIQCLVALRDMDPDTTPHLAIASGSYSHRHYFAGNAMVERFNRYPVNVGKRVPRDPKMTLNDLQPFTTLFPWRHASLRAGDVLLFLDGVVYGHHAPLTEASGQMQYAMSMSVYRLPTEEGARRRHQRMRARLEMLGGSMPQTQDLLTEDRDCVAGGSATHIVDAEATFTSLGFTASAAKYIGSASRHVLVKWEHGVAVAHLNPLPREMTAEGVDDVETRQDHQPLERYFERTTKRSLEEGSVPKSESREDMAHRIATMRPIVIRPRASPP